ncbi:hypothetical protein ACWEPC_51955, partial [Nonomuraea sp. NPDC004297]
DSRIRDSRYGVWSSDVSPPQLQPPRPPVLAGGALSPVLLALLARAPADRPDTTATRATLAKIAETGPAVASTEPGSAMESAEAGLRG